MVQVLHGSAKTTQAVRRAIQHSQESIKALAAKYSINPKTLIKWRKRQSTEDLPMGPKDAHSTVLSIEEEAMIVAFRRHTLLPLDDCLYALQPTIPHLSRSSLHRSAGEMQAAEFLRKLQQLIPYKIHTVLTDNGVQFTNRKKDRYALEHIFDRVCRQADIEHRLTKINHPWTNGQVQRMNRTIKELTVNRYHYDNHLQLETHPKLFLDAYNFARRLKTLKGLTPFEFICKNWTSDPSRFIINPTNHLCLGLNI